MADFENSSVRELKIEDGDFHLYLSKNNQPTTNAQSPTTKPAIQQDNGSQQQVVSDAQIKAPLVGTVYLQSKPQQPPYVKVGSHVHKGDVVCVIEAMKMMTEVKSDVDGVISAVKVDNGELVEYQQPLFTVKKGD